MGRRIKLLDANFNDGKGWQPGVSMHCAPQQVTWDRVRPELDPSLVVITDHKLDTRVRARTRIAWLVESPAVMPHIYDPARTDYARFKRVITFHRGLLNTIPNAVEGLMGGTTLRRSDIALWPKTKLVSMVASTKGWTEGHKFRLQVADRLAPALDLFGRGRPRALEFKIDGLKDYAFSVAAENGRVPDYFSEKLIDCFLTGTVPIYWGVPTVGKWFNLDGILRFDTVEEAERCVAALTMDKYLAMLPAVTDNYHRAQRFVCPEDEYLRLGWFNP